MEAHYKIHQAFLVRLELRLHNLAAKAAKMGLPYNLTAKVLETNNGICDVVVSGDPPGFKDWAFVGVISHLADGNVVRSVPGVVLDSKYQTVSAKCDYCQTVRKRTHSFIVRYSSNNGLVEKQLGRNCLADYFEDKLAPHQMAKIAEVYAVANEIFVSTEKASVLPSSKNVKALDYLDVKMFLAATFAWLRQHSWISRSEAHKHIQIKDSAPVESTADSVLQMWFTGKTLFTPDDLMLAAQAVEWAENLNPQNGFEDAVRDIVGSGSPVFLPKQAGVVAAAARMFSVKHDEDIQRALREQAGEKDEWFGEPGSFIDRLPVTLVKKALFMGKFGPSVLLDFRAIAGARIVVFSAPPLANPLKPGAHLFLTGRIHKHDLYNGKKSTVVKNAVVDME